MKILLTGFEAFGDVEKNPTQVIVEQMAKSHDLPAHIELVCEILPVEYEASGDCIRQLIDQHQPDAVVMTGVAARRDKINVEFWARNNRTATIPDNSGVLLENQPINLERSIDHFLPATLPVFSIYKQLTNARIPVERSNSAGGYICNNVFYSAVDYLQQIEKQHIPVGFIHIPLFDAISQEDMSRAYHMILENIAQVQSPTCLEANMYMNPAVELALQSLLEKIPANPSWITLVHVDDYVIGHVGKPADIEQVRNLVISCVRVAKRVASETLGHTYDYTVLGGEGGVLGVFTISDTHIIAIHWEEATSLKAPDETSKLFPEALKPLLERLEA